MNLDERIQQVIEQTHVEWPELQVVRPPFEPGDQVKVRVTHISHNGAYVVTVDGEWKGRIHIGEIADAYIEDIADWFEAGEELEAKVVRIHRDGKMEFSTKHLRLTPKGGDREMREMVEKEMERIREKLESVVGVLSPESQERLERLIKQHGLFHFGFGLAKALETFKPDLSYYLVNEIERKMRDGL